MRNLVYKDNSGHITVETVGTFIPFVLLIISILSLVNIVSVQARVHYALTQVAMTLSVYSYPLEAAEMNQGLNMLIMPLIKGKLANGAMSGDEYLRRSGIENLWLETVELPNRNGDVKLTMQYEIDYTFGALPLPFGPTLKVEQTVVTKGWQSGSGEGYR